MSRRKRRLGEWRSPPAPRSGPPGSPAQPDLGLLLRGEDVLERAHAVARDVDERVRDLPRPEQTPRPGLRLG
jgi:hypothetical protein